MSDDIKVAIGLKRSMLRGRLIMQYSPAFIARPVTARKIHKLFNKYAPYRHDRDIKMQVPYFITESDYED